MSVLRITTAANSGYLEKIVSLAAASGTLTFYSGTMPSVGGGSASGCTVLAQVVTGNPLGSVAYDSGSNSYKLTFGASTPDGNTAAAGTATWARLAPSGGGWIADFDVTATGGGGAITMPSVAMYQGGIMSLNNCVITLPV